MHSNPEFTHHYRKDNTPEQDAIEERIVQSTYKAITEQIDINKEVQAANSRARVAIISIIVATIVIIALGVWWSGAHAEIINMDAIAQIESSGNPQAYNPQDGAIGLYQITPIVLKEYNNYHAQKFTREDLYNEHINFEIASWYMRVRIPQMLAYYNLPLTTENKIIAWNAGISNARKGRIPDITRQYLKKYAKLTGGAR
jgi:hypothetical protein